MIQFIHPAVGLMLNSVAAACRICRSVQEDLVLAKTVSKDDRSPVTVADFASQAVVARELRAALPNVPLIGEESADLLREPGNEDVLRAILGQVGRTWPEATADDVLTAIDYGAAVPEDHVSFFTLDPIDGTKGFLRGDQYAVALALVSHGKVEVGVLGCPNLKGPDGTPGALYAAVRGRGAMALSIHRQTPTVVPIRVSPEENPANARFCQSVEKAHSHKGRAGRVAEILGVTAEPVNIDSQCKYAMVAHGDAELYLRIPRDDIYEEKIWDHAAGSIIVEEAGGTVTDVNGDPLDFNHGRTLKANRGVVASNGPIHDEVIRALARTR
jgi:HAL2 family 3'(2'),5'-bisphosphate nucleotidase